MVHILGGGIAGLTLAAALERLEVHWQLYEKNAAPGLEASGKNAGIIRTYESDPLIRVLAERSLKYYRDHEPSFIGCGLLIDPWEIEYAAETSQLRKFSHGRKTGYFLRDNGTVEPEAVINRLKNQPYLFGAIRLHTELKLRASDRQVAFMGAAIAEPDDRIVVCCGDGSVPLMQSLPLHWSPGLVAHRRTLYSFNDLEKRFENQPVEWDENSGAYWRYLPAEQAILATAGEQIPWDVTLSIDDSLPDEKALAILEKENPFLKREYLKAWRTCRRLMAMDNRPYAGADPYFTNLYWFTGLGGRGMSIAPALAEDLAQVISGRRHQPDHEQFLPARALVS